MAKSILGDQEINWIGDNDLVSKTKKKEGKKVKKVDNSKVLKELNTLITDLEKSKSNLLNIQKSMQSKYISDVIINIELSLLSLDKLK